MERPQQNETMKICRMLGIAFACFTFLLSYAYGGNSSSQTAYAKAIVKTSLGISKSLDLEFGDRFPGDAMSTITPESSSSAKFLVSGEPTRAYNIILPAQLNITTGNGVGADKQIPVIRFNSSPSRSGKLDALGQEVLRVGATLGNIKPTQESGNYTGTFTVTVVYQ